MRKVTLALLALLVASCGGGGIIVVPPPPPPKPLQFNVSIYDEAGAPVTDASGKLDLDVNSGEPPIILTATGWRESFNTSDPPAHDCWGATLTVTSPSYLTSVTKFAACGGELPTVVMKAEHTWGDEVGWLHTDGIQFLTELNRPWRYKGYTAYTYLQQYCNGEDIDPLIEDAAATGARVFRVAGMYKPWLGTFTLAVDNPALFDSCVINLGHEVRDHGLRMELVVFLDAQLVMPSVVQQQAWYNHIVALIANEPEILAELCNECEKNGVDPSQFQRPQTRTLWSRGSGLGGGVPPSPGWSYTTNHPPRDYEYPRKVDCWYYMSSTDSPLRGIPCVEDEPMGASERDKPGSRAGAINGDPTEAIHDFTYMGGNFSLQTAGGTFHSDAGSVGGILGPVQHQMAVQFYLALNFAPPEAHIAAYQRGDNCGDCPAIGNMPAQQLDQYELRIYSRLVGPFEYTVDIRGTRPFLTRDGWRVVDNPSFGLYKETR